MLKRRQIDHFHIDVGRKLPDLQYKGNWLDFYYTSVDKTKS